MNTAHRNHTETSPLPEGSVSHRKSEFVLSSWAGLEVFGERVRKALQSELIPGRGEVPTETTAFMC